jgi:type IV fimbrial biogenesis protein FimT
MLAGEPDMRAPTLLSMQGYSLVEALITISIAAILLSVAAPNFSEFIRTQRVASATREFQSSLSLTRAEAIKRGARVDMVANDGQSWNSGWRVFVDRNDNWIYDDNETLIFQHDALPTEIAVSSRFTDSTVPYISYTGSGRSRTKLSIQQPQLGTVSFSGGNAIRRVKVNFLGRARSCDPANDKKTCSPNLNDN